MTNSTQNMTHSTNNKIENTFSSTENQKTENVPSKFKLFSLLDNLDCDSVLDKKLLQRIKTFKTCGSPLNPFRFSQRGWELRNRKNQGLHLSRSSNDDEDDGDGDGPRSEQSNEIWCRDCQAIYNKSSQDPLISSHKDSCFWKTFKTEINVKKSKKQEKEMAREWLGSLPGDLLITIASNDANTTISRNEATRDTNSETVMNATTTTTKISPEILLARYYWSPYTLNSNVKGAECKVCGRVVLWKNLKLLGFSEFDVILEHWSWW